MSALTSRYDVVHQIVCVVDTFRLEQRRVKLLLDAEAPDAWTEFHQISQHRHFILNWLVDQ